MQACNGAIVAFAGRGLRGLLAVVLIAFFISLRKVSANIRAILQPPLRETDRKKIADLFGSLVGVGLDEVSPLR